MSEKEMRELDAWIALNVTKTLRRLTDEEYDVVKKLSEEANQEPHPNLMLTLPYRYEGSCPNYTTDPADAMMVLEKISGIGSVGVSCTSNKWFAFSTLNPAYGVESETLPLAICLFAKKLCEK